MRTVLTISLAGIHFVVPSPNSQQEANDIFDLDHVNHNKSQNEFFSPEDSPNSSNLKLALDAPSRA